jgi:hypothetical protein
MVLLLVVLGILLGQPVIEFPARPAPAQDGWRFTMARDDQHETRTLTVGPDGVPVEVQWHEDRRRAVSIEPLEDRISNGWTSSITPCRRETDVAPR